MNEASPIADPATKLPAEAATVAGKIGVLLVNLGTPDAADAATKLPWACAVNGMW